jgi:hypothetical protein
VACWHHVSDLKKNKKESHLKHATLAGVKCVKGNTSLSINAMYLNKSKKLDREEERCPFYLVDVAFTL